MTDNYDEACGGGFSHGRRLYDVEYAIASGYPKIENSRWVYVISASALCCCECSYSF